MNKSIILTLPDEKPISWNKFYSGKHWSIRKNEVDRVRQVVRAAIDPNCDMFSSIVDIEIRAYFANKRLQLDASNIAAKLYEDGLIGWLIEDDSPNFVRSMKTVSLLDRDNPRIEIEIKSQNYKGRMQMNITKEELEMLVESETDEEWNSACDQIKKNHGGNYPSDWYIKVIVGLKTPAPTITTLVNDDAI